MDYKNYDAYDFLNDEFFVLWVKKPTAEANQFWESWITQHPEKSDEIDFARKIVLSARFERLNIEEAEKDELLAGMLSQLDLPNSRSATKPNVYNTQGEKTWQKVAAIITLLILSVFVFDIANNKKDNVKPISEELQVITKKNPAGIRSKIKLSDGTLVYLNSKSEISFPKVFDTNRREVELIGEAYFEVKKNEKTPFIVTTYGLSTEALGTSFNIKSEKGGEEIAVSLVEGKVRVSDFTKGSQLILNPAEQATWFAKRNTLEKSGFEKEDVISWTKNTLNFNDADFDEVIQRLSDWYGVKFIIQKQPAVFKEYNGSFNNKSLEIILENLSFTSKIEYEIKGDTVIVN